MGSVGGLAMYLARDKLMENECFLLRQTVSDYARFFASAWHRTPMMMPCPGRSSLLEEYATELKELRQALAERFHPTLDHLISKLPRLLAKDWPPVPNHTDLLENNIHVDPQAGPMTGIFDWRDAVVGPFGMSLGGSENMLGVRTIKEGWRYHPNQQELRYIFWDRFTPSWGMSRRSRERSSKSRD